VIRNEAEDSKPLEEEIPEVVSDEVVDEALAETDEPPALDESALTDG
jgi:hypothetical protein